MDEQTRPVNYQDHHIISAFFSKNKTDPDLLDKIDPVWRKKTHRDDNTTPTALSTYQNAISRSSAA